jgi:ectoine hydroxylase-related dioxygenase (phytanoyl-CoA dioxygenase family)
MASLITLSQNASLDDVCMALDRDSAVIIEDMLSPKTMAGFLGDLNPILTRTPFGQEGFVGSRTRRCSALMAKSLFSGDMVSHPLYLGAAKRLLTKEYTWVLGQDTLKVFPTVQLNTTQAVAIAPGQVGQPLHRDDGTHHRYHPGPDSEVQIMYALSDFTAENGATMVVPGSHMWDDQRQPRVEEAVPAVMRKGSGLIYRGSAYHGGGCNRTASEVRLGALFSLTIGYLRQEENQYLVVPLETVKKYPKPIQDLIGYSTSPPYCGWVEQREPSVVLEGGDFSIAAAANLV